MSDDLRTRLMDALEGEYTFDPSETIDEWVARLADAVIRELHLAAAVTYKTSQGREVCIEGYWTEEVTE